MATKKPGMVKYHLTEGGSANARFSELYLSGVSGKGPLLNACVSAGQILKESGLLDIVNSLDSMPEYRNASAREKRKILLSELGCLASIPTMTSEPAKPAEPEVKPAEKPTIEKAAESPSSVDGLPSLPTMGG